MHSISFMELFLLDFGIDARWALRINSIGGLNVFQSNTNIANVHNCILAITLNGAVTPMMDVFAKRCKYMFPHPIDF